MKIAILNDTHFGARGDSQIFCDYFFKFFDDVFFPYCVENKIDTILHLGDFLDRRKFVNFNTLSQVRTKILDRLDELDMEIHCLLGNHDTFYKNTNDLNSLREVFNNYPRFHIYENPTTIQLGGCNFGIVPWINNENKDESLDFIKTCNAPIICGHFEMNGYQVLRGVSHQNGGLDDSLFKRYEMVLSGHFHCKQTKNNVHYLGTQYQITFGDINEDKGFHVFDTENRNLTFIQNPYRMFYQYVWDDNDITKTEELLHMDCEHLEHAFVKVYIETKNKPYMFEKFLDRLYNNSVSNVTLIDVTEANDLEEEEIDVGQDTLSLIYETIDEMDVDDRDKLKGLIRELYMESLSL